jgi:PAS domain S-box-containing protein
VASSLAQKGPHQQFPSRDLFAVFSCSPAPQLLIRPDDPAFTVVAVSDGYLPLSNLTRQQIVGRSLVNVVAEAEQPLLASLRKVIASKLPDRSYAALNTPVPDDDGQVAFILHSVGEAFAGRNAVLVRLDDAMRSLFDADEIITIASKILCEELSADRCAYAHYEDDELALCIESGYVLPGVPKLEGRFLITDFGEQMTRCMRANIPYVADDVEIAEMSAEARAAYRAGGIRSMIGIPLQRSGKLVAALGVSQYLTPRTWLPEEVALVRAVAERCWESIERAQISRELRESEQRLRLSQRAAHIGSFELLIKQNSILWSPELAALYGLPEVASTKSLDDWAKLLAPGDIESVARILGECTAKQQSECSYDFRVILPDGRPRWLRGRAQFEYDAQGNPLRMIGVNIDIHAQKAAEEALRESEQRLRGIFDSMYDCIGLISPDGILLEANRAALEVAGCPREQVVGIPFWDGPLFTITPGAQEAIHDAVLRAAAGESLRFEAGLRHPSGDFRTFDISLHPVTDESGEVVLIVPEAHDITERKLMEDRLREQWEIFDTALSNTPDLTYTFDLEGRFTYANKQLIEVSQRPLNATVGRTVADLGYPAELANRIAGQIRQVVETAQSVRDETAFRLPTGVVRDYEYIYAPVIGDDGKVKAIAGSTRDVTDRKRVEEQLRKSEGEFRQLIDALPQLVWSSSPEGIDNLYNKQWFEYTGLSPQDMHGDGWHVIHPDDVPEAQHRWKQSLSTGDPYEMEYRCRRFDGVYRWFLVRAQAIRTERGGIIRWFGTCTDIHDKKESENALRKAHRELEEFSYVASHDLQEPLRMVNIYSQLMLKQLGTEAGAIGQYAGFVRQGVKRMETLLADLLTFSRAVHIEAPSGVADLSASLEEAMAVVKTRIEENGAAVSAGPLPATKGDTEQLAHVFQNLLSNALKYRRADCPPQIRISATRAGDNWTICVEDNGIGFEPQYAERIFGLFKRLHKDEYPGTGLGLAICQRIVERYGGRMWAEGRPGEGSTFFFSLPCVET